MKKIMKTMMFVGLIVAMSMIMSGCGSEHSEGKSIVKTSLSPNIYVSADVDGRKVSEIKFVYDETTGMYEYQGQLVSEEYIEEIQYNGRTNAWEH